MRSVKHRPRCLSQKNDSKKVHKAFRETNLRGKKRREENSELKEGINLQVRLMQFSEFGME